MERVRRQAFPVPAPERGEHARDHALRQRDARRLDVLDAKGQLWSGDYGYDVGFTYGRNLYIANTDSPALYLTERWASDPLTYSFNVPAGTYNVTLKFAEIYFYRGGLRSFNVVINGQQVLTNFDPGLAAGGSYIAVDRTFSVPAVNGRISITFVPVLSNPKISAIEITQ